MEIMLQLPFMIPTLASGIAMAIAIYSMIMKDKLKEKDSLGKNLLRIYLYIISFFSLIMASASIAVILNASLASKYGVQFSYQLTKPYEEYPEKESAPHQNQRENEKKCFSPDEEITIDGKNYCIEKDAVKKDIIGGISIAIPMILIFAIHTIVIMLVEKKYVVIWIKKGYRFISLIFFSIVGLISTSIAINKLVQFFFLKPENFTEISRPGIPLSIALVVLPLWIYFLISTNKIKERKEA